MELELPLSKPVKEMERQLSKSQLLAWTLRLVKEDKLSEVPLGNDRPVPKLPLQRIGS